MPTLDQFVQFLGRLHPLVLHLPIGVLIALGVMEAWPRVRRRQLDAAARCSLAWLAAATTAFAAIAGWLLAREPRYSSAGDTLWWHRWLGVGLAVLVVGASLAQHTRWNRLYAVLLIAALGVMVPAGHFGATLTHGANFLLEPFEQAESAARPPAPSSMQPSPAPAQEGTPPIVAEPVSFHQEIRPIFDRWCISCHGDTKRRGKLSLDSAAALFAGGKSGPVVVPKDPVASLLFARMQLPIDDDKHMPPADKEQPNDEEISLIERWILEGCVVDDQ